MGDKERQLDELMLLQSMYAQDFSWQTPSEQPTEASDISDKEVSFGLRISVYTLEVTLPASYPSSSKPSAYLQCDDTVSTNTRKAARSVLTNIRDRLEAGSECLDILIQELSSALESFDTTTGEDGECGKAPDADILQQGIPQSYKRLLIWSHHLLATSKRKDIISWARELHLSGFSRPGYPGAVVIEGIEVNVDEFETRIKALKWQALQVRGSEVRESPSLVRAGTSIDFKEVEDLSDIVKGLKECEDGLGEWFLEGMKIGRG
ncbi:hypothetical protein CAC42_1982 [Sphaceloma murrayae]|uniref:RWD domain-containing protein n=1 Tax=Sphaceloma murrayae TaxID=2082308 RepID=A0A2K1QIS6_9PEZI|nr:hypothetical protein CAC42_1982 [Sphaceloma murrayae]